MRIARSVLVLCMLTGLAVTGYGVAWGLDLLSRASGYQERTGEGVMYIWLFAPALVVMCGLLVAVLFALVLGFAAHPERVRWARQSPGDDVPVDVAELDRKWARYMHL